MPQNESRLKIVEFERILKSHDIIEFSGIYSNAALSGSQMHSLFLLTLENLDTQHSIRVTLGSSTPENISFQLENENLFGLEVLSQQKLATIPNISSFSSCYNELFNLVNLVEHVTLSPGECRQMVLLFLPPLYSVDCHVDKISNLKFSSQDFPSTLSFRVYLEETPALASCLAEYTVKFKHCHSYFSVQGLSWPEVDLFDCYVGQSQIRDFTIWNHSDIDLYFSLSLEQHSNSDIFILSFIDLESGEEFVVDKSPIPRFTGRKVRMVFKAFQPGDFFLRFSIQNLHDRDNLQSYSIKAFAKSLIEDNSLVIVENEMVDFGDCYVGSRYSRYLTLHNTTEYDLTVKLLSNDSDFTCHIRLFNNDNNPQSSSRLSDYIASSSVDAVNSSLFSTVTSVASSPSLANSSRSVSDADSVSSADSQDEFDSVSPSALDHQSRLSALQQLSVDENSASVEEVFIKARHEKTIEVIYLPSLRKSVSALLTPHSARLTFSYISPRNGALSEKSISMRTQRCLSIIQAKTEKLHFGEVNVGTLKSFPLEIANLSDMPAYVQLRFSSKILNTYRGEMIIPPHKSIEAKIDICPRKINSEYRKQLFVINGRNPNNDQVVEVLANNVDRNRVTFHSLFYNLITTTSTNFLDFGTVLLNNPSLRTLLIENISNAPLSLEITSSSTDEIQIFSMSHAEPDNAVATLKSSSSSSYSHRKEKLLEAIDTRLQEHLESSSNGNVAEPIKVAVAPDQSSVSSSGNSVMSENAAYLDLAMSASLSPRPYSPRKPISARPKRMLTVSNSLKLSGASGNDAELVVDQSLPVYGLFQRDETPYAIHKSDDLISLTSKHTRQPERISESSSSRQSQSDIDAIVCALEGSNVEKLASFDEKKLKSFTAFQKGFSEAISNGRLRPVSHITIPAQSNAKLVILFTANGKNRQYIQSKPKKYDSKIFLKLLDFDRSLVTEEEFRPFVAGDLTSIPVRELMIHSSLCRSIMDIGQKNINFGLVQKRERLGKSILIYNRSEAPLLYSIKKSGSIASGDLFFGSGRIGVIRAYGKREVDFVFYPSLPGMYHEKITVENLLDRENDQVVSVKAQIRKPSTFFINTLSIEFGNVMVNSSLSEIRHVIVENTTRQMRTFELVFDPKELSYTHCTIDLNMDIPANDSKGFVSRFISDEVEDEIERLEQKLKIAQRKGRPDKVKKIIEKLTELKPDFVANLKDDSQMNDTASQVTATTQLTDDKTTETASDHQQPSSSATRPSSASRYKKTSSSLVFSIEPKSSRKITFSLRAISEPTAGSISPVDQEECGGFIYCHEHKNTDYVRKITFNARVIFDEHLLRSLSMMTRHGESSVTHSPSIPESLSRESLPATSAANTQLKEDIYFHNNTQ